jgi:uncharacterized protein YaiL (DUF2058 family)
MAKLSLQEQLLKSGLVGSGQARAVKSEKHKQVKQQQHNKAGLSKQKETVNLIYNANMKKNTNNSPPKLSS